MTVVTTHVVTDTWSLAAHSDAPDPDPRSLVGPLVATWQTGILPPVAQPSAVTFAIYDDGSNPSGILPIDVGDAIGVNVEADNAGTALVTFRGRVADVSASPLEAGGVILSVVCTDWLADLAGIGAKRRVRGSQFSVTGVGGLLIAYDQIADNAGIDLDYHVHESSATPLYRDTRDADLSGLSVLDALSRYVAHDVRGSSAKISRYLGFELDPADPTPTQPVAYSLREYDPRGVNDLAGVLELSWDGSTYSLVVNTDYYTDGGTGVVLDAANLAFDPTEWRKWRGATVNTCDLHGVFDAGTTYPQVVGAFAGASGSSTISTATPNISGMDTLPATVEDGDWAYCFIYAATATIADPVTPPAGWKQIGQISPAQSASTVRGWAYKKRLTTADASTSPVWTFSTTTRWFLAGGVVRNADEPIVTGSTGTNTTGWVNNAAVASTAGSFAAAVTPFDHALGVFSIGARWGTATTAGPPPFSSPGSDYTEWVNAQDPTAGATNRMGAAVFTARMVSDGDTRSPTTVLAAAGNNGIAFSVVFPVLMGADTVRRDFAGLVADYGRNTRTVESPLWYTEDAKALGDVLLGDPSQVPTGYGLTDAVIAWETLTDEQADAIGLVLWPKDEAQVLGRPVAITGIRDDWNLSGSPAVFGRVMAVQITADADKLRVSLTMLNVATLTSAGITYTEANTHSPTWKYNNSDPSITYEQLTLVED